MPPLLVYDVGVAEPGFDRTIHFHRQRHAAAVGGFADGHTDPAFADAIFFDGGAFDAFEPDADAACQRGFVIKRAGRIVTQAVGWRV